MGKDVFSRVLQQLATRGAKSNVPPGYRYPRVEGKPSVAREEREGAAGRRSKLFETECRKRPTFVTVPARWPKQPLNTPNGAVEAFRAFAEGQNHESLMALYLDAQNRPIAFQEVARGGLNSVSVKPREVFRYGVEVGAASIIIAHNHPSGETRASPDDIDITRRMKAAGDLIGIPLLDHIIVTDDGFYSFDSGAMLR